MPRPLSARLAHLGLSGSILALAAGIGPGTAGAAEPAPEVEERRPPPATQVEHPDDLEDPEQVRPLPERVYRTDVQKQVEIGEPVQTLVVSKRASEESAAAWCDQLGQSHDLTLDHARRKLEEMACTTVLWFDGLFGDLYHVDVARAAYGRLEVSNFYSEYFGYRTRVRLDVRGDFPNISRHLSGFFGVDDDEAFVRDRNERFALRSRFPQMRENDRWMAGLGYSLPGSRTFRSDFRVGIRGLAHTRLFVQNRFGYIPWSDDDNLVYLRLTPFWNTADGFGVTTGADVSHVLDDTRLLRWANVATFSQETEGLDWRSALIHYRAMGERRGLAYEAFIRGETDAEVPLAEYGLQLIFRHPMMDQRLWGQWVLGYTWPKIRIEDEREAAFGAGFGIELPFGQKYD